MKDWVIKISDPTTGQTAIELIPDSGVSLSIGREAPFPGPTFNLRISRRHAVCFRKDNRIWIETTGSTPLYLDREGGKSTNLSELIPGKTYYLLINPLIEICTLPRDNL